MGKKIKIQIVNQFACLPYNSYGPGERMYHLVQSLDRTEFESEVYAGSYNHLMKVLPTTQSRITKDPRTTINFFWIRLRKYRKESFFARVYSWFEFTLKLFFFKPSGKPDIVLVSSMSLLPILYAIWLKKKAKCKFILEIRDIWPLTALELGGYSQFNPLIIFLKWVERWGYKSADHIVSVLPDFERYLLESKIYNKKFTWIPNATPVCDGKVESGKNIVLNEERFNIVYAGTMGKANALEYLIKAAELLKTHSDINFVFIGDGPLKEQLMEMSRDCSNVYFFPKVLRSELNAVLAQADVGFIGWHDRKLYNYGVAANKYNDYMLSKLPIISAANFKMDPVILANCGIQVKACDPEAIAKGILNLVSKSESDLEYLGLNGYKYLISNHTNSIVSEKYSNVFKSLV